MGDGACQGFCVIMAGGRGTRFWPLSRASRPKHLLPLIREQSLLRATFERVEPLVGRDRILVITGCDQADAIASQLPELPPERIVGEPVGRNTAPCAVLGLGLAARLAGDLPVALLPADHAIDDDGVFRDQLSQAFDLAAARGGVVTIGINPSRPETGYGYLEIDSARDAQDGVCAGAAFVEKPDHERAVAYLAGGRHLWNSGIFVWDAGAFRTAAASHIPEIVDALEPAIDDHGHHTFDRTLDAAYRACPSISIDHALMEHLSDFWVLKARFKWSDLGSWRAWGEMAPELKSANRGSADVVGLDSHRNVLHVRDKLVALIGVEDLIIVDTGDALLISHRDADQRVKDITDLVKEAGRDDLL
jgi:mannose-1-phosphate guanylyltransferase